MFKIIKPQQQYYYRSRIDLLLELVRLQQDIHLSPEELAHATFILAENDEGHIFGGALLYRKDVRELHNRISNIVSTFVPQKPFVWEGIVFLCLDYYPLEGLSNSILKEFYSGLLKALIGFGNSQGTNHICLRLSPLEYMRLKKRGSWPFLVEVKPEDSPDGEFHGVLSLVQKPSLNQCINRTLSFPQSVKGMAA